MVLCPYLPDLVEALAMLTAGPEARGVLTELTVAHL